MFQKRPIGERPSWVESNRMLLLYTPLMLLLLTFFILLTSRANFDEYKFSIALSSVENTFGISPAQGVGINNPTELSGEEISDIDPLIKKEMNNLNQIRALFSDDILNGKARIIRTRDDATVSLSAALVFKDQDMELNEEMKEKLKIFAKIISSSKVLLVIEGHTDNQPIINKQGLDNWDISSNRALKVLAYLHDEAGLNIDRLSAFGYAGTKPLFPNNTEENRAKNNRIDIVIDYNIKQDGDYTKVDKRDKVLNYHGFDFLIKPIENNNL